jgi:hypothetical protein
VPRLVSTALLISLLAATAVAFAITEGLKLQPAPVRSVFVEPRVFSPTCDCETDAVAIRFRMRKADRLTVTLIAARNEEVRTLRGPRETPKGIVDAVWDGRDDSGSVVPDGLYRPRLHFGRQHRTIVLPNAIRVDTTAPKVTLVRVQPRVFSPDGDGRNDKVTVRYRATEPTRPLLFVNRHRRVVGKFARTTGSVEWYGRVRGRSLPAGTYRIALAGRDVAGNLAATTAAQRVVIRYVAFGRKVVRVVAGRRFRIRFASDARTLHWRFAGGRGLTRPGPLVLRAPLRPGRYRLFVDERGHASALPVIVRPAK